MENEATGNDLEKHLRCVYKRENVSEIEQFTSLISGPVPTRGRGHQRTFKVESAFYRRSVLHVELRNSPDLETYFIIVVISMLTVPCDSMLIEPPRVLDYIKRNILGVQFSPHSL